MKIRASLILGFGFWILGFGFWILDFAARISAQ
jgi:hypothetical protein